MPQMLLALLALVIASMTALNLQRMEARAYEGMIEGETTMMAAAAATHLFELFEEQSFDDRTRPQVMNQWTGNGSNRRQRGMPSGSPEFALAANFGRNNCGLRNATRLANCRDLDDFDGLENEPYQFALGRGAGNQQFEVSADVAYVRADDDDAFGEAADPNERTYHKQVTLEIRSASLTGQTLAASAQGPPILRLERVISYDRRKAINDYRIQYDGAVPAGVVNGG